jgi:uncharacterized membrane protein
VDWLHITINALFVLLGANIAIWMVIYRRLNPDDLPSSRYYRWHQLLVALIALLAILVAVVVVLSSDPGNAEDYLFGP